MVEPIKPENVLEASLQDFPPEVIESFNELIRKNYRAGKSVIKQKDVVALITTKMDLPNDNHWLDVEEFYRKVGWKVEYDKPGYNESYEAYFTFKK